MRILIDTNVLISAALNTDGVPYPASESQIRDADDRPILKAAIEAKADILHFDHLDGSTIRAYQCPSGDVDLHVGIGSFNIIDVFLRVCPERNRVVHHFYYFTTV